MYIDTLDAEPTDARLVVDSVTQSLMNVIPQPEQIDYPNISPEQPTQGDGHHLKYFKGELKVPTIDREHDVEVPMNTTPIMPLPMFALPLLIPAGAGMVRPPVRVKNRRNRNKRIRERLVRRAAARASRKAARARRRQTLKDKRRKARAERRRARIDEKQTRKNAKKINRKMDRYILREEKQKFRESTKPVKPEPDDLPDKLKKQLVEKNPKRFKLDDYGNLLEINPDGTSRRPDEKDLVKILDELDYPNFPKGLKALIKACAVVGIAFTIYDMYRLYDIYNNDELTKDQKITRSGPIIGALLGATGGAAVGAAVGGIGGPWGIFLGALVGGIGGSLAGDELGALVAEYIVGNEAPKHPSGKDWDELTPMELKSWWTYQANKQQETFIDSTSTQQMEPQPFPDLNPPEPQFELLPIPDDVDEPQTDSTNTQLDDLISAHIQQRKQHGMERQQLIEKIQELA